MSSPPTPVSPPHRSIEWEERYLAGDTPWDVGRAHPELCWRLGRGRVGSLEAATDPPTALVCGAGRGHDALALARAGFRVTAVDLAPAPADEARSGLAALGGEFLVGDAFAIAPPGDGFDVVFEHTFFCALDPQRRGIWGELRRRTLRPGGVLEALIFPVDKPAAEGGPPHGMSAAQLASALGAGFELTCDQPLLHRVASRNWSERWARFERRRAGGAG